MTNITDTPGDGSTDTTLVNEHDRGSAAYNTRKGEANTAVVTPEDTPPKPPKDKAEEAS